MTRVDAVPPREPGPAPPARADVRPIRLIVTDDCRRSRVTVLLRLLLAVPHLVWVVLWGLAAFTVAFVVWLAVLVERRAPRTLHDFLAGYLRYSTHLTAYLTLAANPYPGFTGRPGYPVDLEIDPPVRQGRLGAAFRLVLAAPALLLATSIGGGVTGSAGGGQAAWLAGTGGLASVAAVLGWLACLALGRMPQGLRDVTTYAAGYAAQTYGYLFLLTDRYPSADPSFGGAVDLPDHPVRAMATDSLQRSRLTVLFRFPLALPHLVWLFGWGALAVIASVAAWLAALVIGRVPRPLWRFLAAYVRYAAHLEAFVYVVGGPFPGFTGRQGSYPIDLITDEPGPQRRLVTLFRGVLALPALLLSGGYLGVLLTVAILGWFAALFTGRMPGGMRDIGVAAIRYATQASAYLLLVTDRYPHAAPFLRDAERAVQLTLDLEPVEEQA